MPATTLTTVENHHCETLEGVGAKVDREAGILRGVKLIGHDSKNGRSYPPATLRAAVSHYEGVRVNVDHPDGAPGKPRKVADRMGVVANARYVEGHGIFGDFKFNPKHSLTEQVLWDAENNPSAVGFSHNATLRLGPKRNNRSVVEEVVGVRSVDLVADPATTASLFEHDASDGDDLKPETDEMSLENVTLEELKKNRPDLVTALESQSQETSEVESLRAELAAIKAEKSAREKSDAIEAELTEAKLDPQNEKQCSPVFLKALAACESAEDRAELIADRATLVLESIESPPVTEGTKPAAKKPVTTPATEGTGGLDAAAFVRSLRIR